MFVNNRNNRSARFTAKGTILRYDANSGEAIVNTSEAKNSKYYIPQDKAYPVETGKEAEFGLYLINRWNCPEANGKFRYAVARIEYV